MTPYFRVKYDLYYNNEKIPLEDILVHAGIKSVKDVKTKNAVSLFFAIRQIIFLLEFSSYHRIRINTTSDILLPLTRAFDTRANHV